MRDLLEILVEYLSRGEALAVVTIVSHEGSTPRTAGSKMLVDRRGSLVAGSVGGGLLEAAALEAAPLVLESGKPELMDFDLSGELAAGADMICGGRLRVFVEAAQTGDFEIFKGLLEKLQNGTDMLLITALDGAHPGLRVVLDMHGEKGELAFPVAEECRRAARGALGALIVKRNDVCWFAEPWLVPPRMILCGGGHVAQAVVPVAGGAGFEVTVLDDREEFSGSDRFPGASCCRCVPGFTDCFRGMKLDGKSYVVILTRGHVHDALVLEQVLEAGRAGHVAGYVGMIGSRRKREEIYAALRCKGASDAELSRVHCPVGLPIGAETPGEIAVSIVAECIVRRSQSEDREKRGK